MITNDLISRSYLCVYVHMCVR